MKKDVLNIIGITLILLGAIGFLLIDTNIIGNVVSEDKNYLEFSEFEDIMIKNGESKTIQIFLKNNEQTEITNCYLNFYGNNSEWIKNDEQKNIPPDSAADFTLLISVPEEAEINEYYINVEASCLEISAAKKITFSVTNGIEAITIKNVQSNGDILNVTYTFDNKGFIGENTYVDIWVNNPDGFEIARINDQFSINTDKLILREATIDLKENPIGVYTLFLSHPSDSKNYIKKSIILGKSKTSGNAIFKIVEGKKLPYISFLLFIAIGTFFIFRSHKKSVQKNEDQIGSIPKSKISKTKK